jgi:hypothetical protein
MDCRVGVLSQPLLAMTGWSEGEVSPFLAVTRVGEITSRHCGGSELGTQYSVVIASGDGAKAETRAAIYI